MLVPGGPKKGNPIQSLYVYFINSNSTITKMLTHNLQGVWNHLVKPVSPWLSSQNGHLQPFFRKRHFWLFFLIFVKYLIFQNRLITP